MDKVLLIENEDIRNLHISPDECVEWTIESMSSKYDSILPPKISIHPQGTDFFNTMPCCIPGDYFGVKEVSRIAGREPSLSSEMLLYSSKTGKLLALIDCDWITAMRTGAVAAITISRLAKMNVRTFSFLGLGNTARATALCLTSIYKDEKLHFRLKKYKDQAESFIERFKDYSNISFEIFESDLELIKNADVLISSISDAKGLICEDESLFKKGILLVPIHTRGFQNCDLFFDKVYGDDKAHVEGFKYFNRFKYFAETSEVIIGKDPGRENENERILAYNIGLGLHDVFFASRIYEMLRDRVNNSFELKKEISKFWI